MRIGLKKRFPVFRLLCCLLTAVVFVCIILFFLIRSAPVFQARAADVATQAVRNCIDDISAVVFEDFDFFEAADISSEDVYMIDMNTMQMNALRTSFSTLLAEKLAQTHSAKISIPFGSLFGYPALQGLGVKIPVKIYFGSISSAEITDEFASAGINQTKYSAKLDITVVASVVSAFMCDVREIHISLPICERILIGNVPNYYIPGKG